MEVTDVKIQLLTKKEGRLLAFCTITLDNCFVVRDLRVIDGERGPFVAMPSRKMTAVCKKCQTKNYLTSKFCNECGIALPNKVEVRADGRRKLFTDIAHPVNMDARERIQTEIVRAYRLELERSKSPGYQAQDLDALYQDDNSFQREDPPHSAKPAADSHLNKTNSPADKASARRENPE